MVQLDFMLDDYPKKLASLMPWIRLEAFLFDRENNRACLDIYNRFVRVKSWDEFYSRIHFFEQSLQK